MKNNTQRNNNLEGCISQQRKLSFYEENYILEPEDLDEDKGYFEYESDDSTTYSEDDFNESYTMELSGDQYFN